MMKICILYGGKSGEHEVSLRSAASVVKNLDPKRYEVLLIGIDKAGRWHAQKEPRITSVPGQGDMLSLDASPLPLSVVPSDGIHDQGGKLPIDCVFPVLHGSFGEDGTVQGLLEVAGLPYVGPGVLGSSAAMDKETTKRIWRDADLPIVEFEVVDRDSTAEQRRQAATRVGWPAFVKPCSAGSSLGVARVPSEAGLDAAVEEALRYDTRALIERCVAGREIECSVVGSSHPRAFFPGEVVTAGKYSFYDYDAKYLDPNGARLDAPAKIDPGVGERIMRTAERAFSVLRCEGMARVDFFLENDREFFLNEINTIPGFTSISMFPRMCEAGGLPYGRLLETLIDLAMERNAVRASVRYEK